jgi:hypothetical protein
VAHPSNGGMHLFQRHAAGYRLPGEGMRSLKSHAPGTFVCATSGNDRCRRPTFVHVAGVDSLKLPPLQSDAPRPNCLSSMAAGFTKSVGEPRGTGETWTRMRGCCH